MLHKSHRLLLLIAFTVSALVCARAQTLSSTTPSAKENGVAHRVQIQLLVASNIATAKTNYPASLEAVVKQLKSSLPYKTHYVVATYIYNVADKGGFEVGDVTYAPFEGGGGLAPTFFNVNLSGITLNGDSIHISRFRFDLRKRIFITKTRGEGTTTNDVFENAGTGITTELNVREGTPTIVGTTASALSDGVLVLVITVDHAGTR
jgi:hypothetical protein